MPPLRVTLILCFTLAIVSARPLGAQATMLVDATDPVYHDIGRLLSYGLVDRAVVGQKPFSRREIVRIGRIAKGRLDSLDQEIRAADGRGDGESRLATLAFLEEIVGGILERFDVYSAVDAVSERGKALRVEPLRAIGLELSRVDSPTRPIPASNGLGWIDAELNTLLANRRGRPLTEGWNVVAGTAHLLESANLALYVVPELYLHARSGSDVVTRGRIQELQARLLFRNVALDVGRENLMWGQGREVGLLLSNNSPGLDLVRVSNERLLTPPWIFRRLGATKLSLFYADLGAAQNFPHAYLVAYKISIAPTARVELGTSVYVKSGGHGAPRASASARILDLFPFLDAGNYANVVGVRGKFEFSDHYAGIDGRLRWPSARGTELFWEVLLNDFDIRRLGSVFWEDAGHVFGLSVARLDAIGRLGASVEYHHTGIRYYEHQQFTSGQTLRRTLIGDPLGPDAHGAYANVDWYRSARDRVSLEAAWERRSNDEYEYLPVALPAFGFQRVLSRPKELRARVITTWRRLPVREGVGMLAQFGYEQSSNFAFVAGRRETGLLGRLGLEYRFR